MSMLVPGRTIPEFSGVPLEKKERSKWKLCNIAQSQIALFDINKIKAN